MTRQSVDITLICIAAAVLFAAFAASALSGEVFFTYFGAEDSVIENATAILLAICGVALWARALSARSSFSRGAVILGVLYGLVYIWAGGEEISWGQRLLDYESPEFFQENNDQQEFTFHNLVVGGVKLDELIFGPVLSYVILSYLIVLPLVWPRVAWVQRLVRRMIIPVPRPYHAAVALAVTLIIPFLDESRRWEVYECIFALLSLAIFLHPANPINDYGTTHDPMIG